MVDISTSKPNVAKEPETASLPPAATTLQPETSPLATAQFSPSQDVWAEVTLPQKITGSAVALQHRDTTIGSTTISFEFIAA